MAYLIVKCHFVYTTEIHKYERTYVLEKYAHNVTQYVYSVKLMFSPYPQHKSKNVLSSDDVC